MIHSAADFHYDLEEWSLINKSNLNNEQNSPFKTLTFIYYSMSSEPIHFPTEEAKNMAKSLNAHNNYMLTMKQIIELRLVLLMFVTDLDVFQTMSNGKRLNQTWNLRHASHVSLVSISWLTKYLITFGFFRTPHWIG